MMFLKLYFSLVWTFSLLFSPFSWKNAGAQSTHRTDAFPFQNYLSFVTRVVQVRPFLNGDFESGPVEWEQFSSHELPLILPASQLPFPPHSGSWMAQLGGHASGTAVLSKTFDLPADGWNTLYFSYSVISEDERNNDFAKIYIDGREYFSVDLSKYNGNRIPWVSWVQHPISISGSTGDTVHMTIEVTNNGSYPSSFFVDDFSFAEFSSTNSGAKNSLSPDALHPDSLPNLSVP